MSDIPIINASLLDVRPKKIVPTYLVVFEDTNPKKYVNFIATKVDETTPYIKLVGFKTDESAETVVASFNSLLEKEDKNNYVEISLPWHRVVKVQSLIFKQKA